MGGSDLRFATPPTFPSSLLQDWFPCASDAGQWLYCASGALAPIASLVLEVGCDLRRIVAI